MARQSSSQDDSSEAQWSSSRRSSRSYSNPNVFSDDYALEPLESGSLTPTASIPDTSEHLSLGTRTNASGVNPNYHTASTHSAHLFGLDRPLSTSKRPLSQDPLSSPHRALSGVSQSDAATQRTFSTSSRFSIARPQSPYTGPTAPSQPYSMYPQVTRASSIASGSTLRPLENPFILQGGPEHPYSMYPQNTVPEDDDSVGADIPLGFPGMGTNFHGGSVSSGNDTGDIVGSDGHVEQLPPYTRYADNVIAKGDMARVQEPAMAETADPDTASDAQVVSVSNSNTVLNNDQPQQRHEETARKEGWVEKSRRRKCCGLPSWIMMLLVGVFVLAAAVGGVIGGVVGNERGTDSAAASATTTVWLDANPTSTGPLTPACPTGHYLVPLNQTQEVHTCIAASNLDFAWGCMDVSQIGITVFEASAQQNGPLNVRFDDYSVAPQDFRYGPQPPDFNGSAFPLQPFMDKDDSQLGVAMFFSVLFDKIIILPEDTFTAPGSNRRSISEQSLYERGEPWDGTPLEIAEKPWYCFWNSTVNEFWIFLHHDATPAVSSTSTSTASTSSVTPPPTSASTMSGSSLPTYPGAAATSVASSQTVEDYDSAPTSNPYPTWTPEKARRGYASNAIPDFYPKVVKMVEKRKPSGNSQPYCQQMQVLNNWQIMPIPGVSTIQMSENQYTPTATAGSSKRWDMRHWMKRDTTTELESNCVCEWMTSNY